MAAGLALLQLGASVLTVERSTYSDTRIGEYLQPEAKALLSSLAVPWEEWEDTWIPCPVLRSSWGEDEPISRDSIFSPFGEPLLLARSGFDKKFASVVEEAGVEILRGARLRRWERHNESWKVFVSHNGQLIERSCEYIIDATGRSASFAKRIGGQARKYDKLVALVAIYGPGLPDSSSVVEIETAFQGWWYSANLPEGALVVNYYTNLEELERPIRSTFDSRLNATKCTQARVANSGTLRKLLVRSACSQRLVPCVGPGWVAVGDAAMSYDPLTGCGMMEAIQSGIDAAQAIATKGWNRYQASHDSKFAAYVASRHKYYGMENRWKGSRFWAEHQAWSPCHLQKRDYANLV